MRAFRREASILSILLTLLAGARVPVGAEPVAETEEVIAVEVPVQVVKGGVPVRGLTADNFEVVFGGEKQRITDFDVVDLTLITEEMTSTPAMTVPSMARRHFLFLFDLTFADVGSVLRARGAVQGILDEMHATDLGAVATYTVDKGPDLILGFTSDKRQVHQAIETLGAPNLIHAPSADPLSLTLVQPLTMAPEFGGVADGGGVSEGRAAETNAMVQEHLLSLQQGIDRTNQNQERYQATALTRDFAILARMMSGVDGRKYVVYLSEGFNSDTLIATGDRARTSQMNRAVESGEIWTVDSETRFGSARAQSEMDTMIEEFRRADCAIQAINISEAAAEDFVRGTRSGNDALFMMADGTGGELYRNFNVLDQAIGELIEKTNVTYILVFQPDQLAADGSYHKLKVKLRDAPKGARVIHRPGVYAPRPYEQQSGLERRLRAADLILAGEERGDLPISVLAVPFKRTGGTARVILLVQVDGSGLLRGQATSSMPLEVYGYAVDGSGSILDFVANAFNVDLVQNGAKIRDGGLLFYGEIVVPAGRQSVRVLVRSALTGAHRVENVPLTVPAFDAGALIVLQPLIPEPLGEGLLVRGPAKVDDTSQTFPFMARGEPYLPGTRPRIAVGGESRLRLVLYNAPSGSFRVEGRILDPTGASVGEVSIVPQERSEGATPGSDLLLATLRVEGVAPGRYTLDVSVIDPASERGGSSSIPVEILAR